MILLILFLLLITGFAIYLNASSNQAGSISQKKGLSSRPEGSEVALSGEGLFCLFAPSQRTLQMLTLGLGDLVINDPRLIAFQKSYGPVEYSKASEFASQAAYCQGASEMLRPLGSATAFVGRASKRPSLEGGFLRLVRIDSQGYHELCSGEQVSLVYISGVLRDSDGALVPANFFLPVLSSQLVSAAGSPYATTEFQGLQLHGVESDSYWVIERVLALAEAFQWLSDIDQELLTKFTRLRQLAKTASENPLMEQARPRINKALLETRNLCDQMPGLLRDLEKRLKDVFDWVLLPKEFKDSSSIQEGQFDLGELTLVKERYEEVASLIDLYPG